MFIEYNNRLCIISEKIKEDITLLGELPENP